MLTFTAGGAKGLRPCRGRHALLGEDRETDSQTASVHSERASSGCASSS
jgi:hypothetical protein